MLKSISSPFSGLVGDAIACDLTAFATVQATADELDSLRKKPALLPGVDVSTAMLKQSDHQTIAGLLALSRAIQTFSLDDGSFTRWGVLGAPRMPGRSAMAVTIQRFAVDGGWGVSPQVIPHCSLHSLSGALSQGLKLHGPNLGVGGMPGGEAAALLAAATFLASEPLPGIWVVLTGWAPELIPGQQPSASETPICRAAALAMTDAQPGWDGLQLRVKAVLAEESNGPLPAFCLEDLCTALTSPSGKRTPWLWQLEAGWQLELVSDAEENEP